MRIERSKLNLIAAYGILLMGCVLMQTTALAPLRIFGLTPTLYIAATVCVAMFEGGWAGGAFGFLLGYAVDATVGATMGLTALTLLLAGLATGFAAKAYMLRKLLSSALLYGAVQLVIVLAVLLLRLLVTADMAGFAGWLLRRAAISVISAPYLLPFYYIARAWHRSFGGAEES